MPREWHARLARDVVIGLRCRECLALYAWLLIRQATSTYAVDGIITAADALGWQYRTTRKHFAHLLAVGIITAKELPGRTRFSVAHAPADTAPRTAALRVVPGVWDPAPQKRWRPPAGDLTRFEWNAERDAPSVRTEPAQARGATRQAFAEGATRPSDDANAERDAPSVLEAKKKGV